MCVYQYTMFTNTRNINEHTMQNKDEVFLNCILETYDILTNVTSKTLIKKIKIMVNT